MKQSASPVIRLLGVRHNNLKNFNLDLPMNRLIVMTGLSGSGKSSLAFDTLFAEGQRRYIETFSPYARQFFDRMDKPQVDRIEGIPPAIAIEQTNTVRTTRSTVGTMTELCDYMKVLWPHVSHIHCSQCGDSVWKDTPQRLWDLVSHKPEASTEEVECLVTFDLPLSEKLSLDESLSLVARQGYQRILLKNEIIRLEDAAPRLSRNQRNRSLASLTLVQDRIRLGANGKNRARFVDACEQAYHFGKGRLTMHGLTSDGHAADPQPFSRDLHCAKCDLAFREPSPALFSFNHPLGACSACKGFGRIISIDYDLALPDRSKTLAEGVVKPWLTGQGAECQADMIKFCKKRKVPMDVPFSKLPRKWQKWVIQGDPSYGKDAAHEWPKAWYGVKGYFRWLESKAYKMHVRVLLSRYRAYSPCPDCQGRRFQPESLLYKVEPPRPGQAGSGWTLADFYQASITEALDFIQALASRHSFKPHTAVGTVLQEITNRLQYLADVGLGYLTLDRPTRSLSGGETERVNLTSCIGSRMVNTLFVLDEPSVGLHPRDTERLVRLLQNLRDTGNTVVVVEHEAGVMRAADQIVDLGPGQGESGGQIVYQGSFKGLLHHPTSLTAHYLNGTRDASVSAHRAVPAGSPRLVLKGATRHNLNQLNVEIPLQRFVCLTGVSGSGKTTLAREILLPALESHLKEARQETKVRRGKRPVVVKGAGGETLAIEGDLTQVVLVDQSSLGRTPRSNPAVYVGAFEDIRELYAQTDLARQRGLKASSFSFNSALGQCERCRGAGFEKIEMQFLSDVFIRCPDCQGRRYRDHILDIKLTVDAPASAGTADGTLSWSIADILEATVDDVIHGIASYGEIRAGRRALSQLQVLQEVGLGYLRLGQPINTLSGGECQRLKLAAHLAESGLSRVKAPRKKLRQTSSPSEPEARGSTLFIFDEPTTGLHFHDVWILMKAFQRLVDAGHSLLVIEHNLEVVRSADWVIDLGPEGGDQGGRVVAIGSPSDIAACAQSHTGRALKPLLEKDPSGAALSLVDS